MYKMPSLTGWTCPKCGNVYSPHTTMCGVCNQTIKTTNTSGGIDECRVTGFHSLTFCRQCGNMMNNQYQADFDEWYAEDGAKHFCPKCGKYVKAYRWTVIISNGEANNEKSSNASES